MRIWIVNHYASPPTTAGGTRHYNFARELRKRGHDVLIIAANYNHLSKSFMSPVNPGKQIDDSHDVPFLWLPVPAYKGNSMARFWNMLVFAWMLRLNKLLNSSPPPDVIIGSSPHLFAALGAELLARHLRKPFILEIRDLWPESLLDLGRFTQNNPLIRIMRWVEHYLYKRAEKIISLLPSANDYLMRLGVNEQDIVWIPNYIDVYSVPHFDFIPNKKFTLMYAGAHGVANDLDTIILAAKILENRNLADAIRICLIGNGPEKDRLKALAESKNIKMIEFLDAVPKNDIYSILNQADGYIMLLKDTPVFRWGISPNKLFDYLVMERPVIFGVNTPFNPIKLCNAGISIKPSDPDDLANAIYRLSLIPKDELKNMGQRGKDFVLKYHHIHELTNTLESLVHDVCRTVLTSPAQDPA